MRNIPFDAFVSMGPAENVQLKSQDRGAANNFSCFRWKKSVLVKSLPCNIQPGTRFPLAILY